MESYCLSDFLSVLNAIPEARVVDPELAQRSGRPPVGSSAPPLAQAWGSVPPA